MPVAAAQGSGLGDGPGLPDDGSPSLTSTPVPTRASTQEAADVLTPQARSRSKELLGTQTLTGMEVLHRLFVQRLRGPVCHSLSRFTQRA
jgi:hypothetical protein